MPTLPYLLAEAPRGGPLFTPLSPGCSGTAWQTLLRDGDLVELREGFAVVAGVVETAALRAGTFAGVVTVGLALARHSAAWVHTGGELAAVRTCVVYRPGASRPRTRLWLDAVQAPLRPWDVEDVGGVAVTTPVRTAMDLATWCTDDQARHALLRLAAAGADLRSAAVQLDRTTGWRGARLARRRLHEAARQAERAGPSGHAPLVEQGHPDDQGHLAERARLVDEAGQQARTVEPLQQRDRQACTTGSAALDPVMR